MTDVLSFTSNLSSLINDPSKVTYMATNNINKALENINPSKSMDCEGIKGLMGTATGF